MGNKHMKRCLTRFIIRKSFMETALKYHFTMYLIDKKLKI